MTFKINELDGLKDTVVVIDTNTHYVYVGTLKAADEGFLVLADADVHDISEGSSTKEMYAVEARRHGVQKNRREVLVRTSHVVSLSRLDDVILY